MGDFSSKTKNRVTKKMTGWHKLLQRISLLGGYQVHVGVLASQGGNAQHEDAAAKGTVITLLELAAIHEFGSPAAGIPERSFIRATFNSPTGRADLRKLCGKLAKKVVEGSMKAERATELLGMHMQTMIKRRIMTGDGVPPPLAESTVAAKGSTRPLFDSGQLVGSITYEVRPKK